MSQFVPAGGSYPKPRPAPAHGTIGRPWSQLRSIRHDGDGLVHGLALQWPAVPTTRMCRATISSQLDQRGDGAGRGRSMLASAPSSRATTAFVMTFPTNSRPALRAAACGGRPRAGSYEAEPSAWLSPLSVTLLHEGGVWPHGLLVQSASARSDLSARSQHRSDERPPRPGPPPLSQYRASSTRLGTGWPMPADRYGQAARPLPIPEAREAGSEF